MVPKPTTKRGKALRPITRRGGDLLSPEDLVKRGGHWAKLRPAKGSRREDMIQRGRLWADRLARWEAELTRLKQAELPRRWRLAEFADEEPNPKRRRELEDLFEKVANKLEDSDVGKFRRRVEDQMDMAATVDFAEQVLRHFAASDRPTLRERPNEAAIETLKALAPTWGANKDLIKLVLVEAKLLDLDGRIDVRCPFREIAIKVAAKFQELPVSQVRRLLTERFPAR